MFLHSLNFYGFVYSTSLSTCFQYFSPADYFWVKMVLIVGFKKFFYFDRNLKLFGVLLKLLSLNTLLKIFKKSTIMNLMTILKVFFSFIYCSCFKLLIVVHLFILKGFNNAFYWFWHNKYSSTKSWRDLFCILCFLTFFHVLFFTFLHFLCFYVFFRVFFGILHFYSILLFCTNSWHPRVFLFLYSLCFYVFYIFPFFCIFAFFAFLHFCTFLFCTFCTFVLCHLVRQSIWTSMQNLQAK